MNRDEKKDMFERYFGGRMERPWNIFGSYDHGWLWKSLLRTEFQMPKSKLRVSSIIKGQEKKSGVKEIKKKKKRAFSSSKCHWTLSVCAFCLRAELALHPAGLGPCRGPRDLTLVGKSLLPVMRSLVLYFRRTAPTGQFRRYGLLTRWFK